MNRPTDSTIKKLFAFSNNRCAFPDCTNAIVDRNTLTTTGKVCHIKAKSNLGPRWDKSQTDEERHGFQNLILLCGKHHDIVDDKSQEKKFTVEILTGFKKKHEQTGNNELSQDDAKLARRLIDSYLKIDARDEAQVMVNSPGATQIKNIYQRPPTVKIIRERRPGSVTPEEVHQIGEWIKELAEGEVDKTRDEAFKMWGGRFKKHFRLGHREDLLSTEMQIAEEWHRTQKAIQTSGLKTKVPDLYERERINSNKAAMNEMGKTNETYYPELAMRLKLKKPFASLKKLTRRNLDRVYNMVRGDVRKLRS
jgi:hypothetical protein